MIRPAYVLYTLPWEELLQDVQLVLDHDAQEFQKQLAYFQRLTQEGEKSQAYLDRLEARLEHSQTRQEFFKELLCRCQTYHLRCIAMALERGEKEAALYGRTNNYGVMIFFNGQEKPEIIPF